MTAISSPADEEAERKAAEEAAKKAAADEAKKEIEARQAEEARRTLNLAKYCIALITGLAIFLPSSEAFIKPPYSEEWVLLIGFAFGLVGFGLSSASIVYIEVLKQAYNGGTFGRVGFIFTLVALFSVLAYVFINVYIDRTAGPRISEVNIEPKEIYIGDVVRITAAAQNEDRDHLVWSWTISSNNEDFSGFVEETKFGNLLWEPRTAGEYEVRIVAKDRDDFDEYSFNFSVRGSR